MREVRSAQPGSVNRPTDNAEWMALVYDELRQLSHHYLQRERAGHTLQATALVHEAYVRLVARNPDGWRDVDHFFFAAARAVRRVLVDYARARRAAKRGGGRAESPLSLDIPMIAPDRVIDVMDLDGAINELARLHPRQAQVVELRYFGGLTEIDVARLLGITDRTVRSDWVAARAWLRMRLGESGSP